MKKSLGTRLKREAVVKVSELITGELQRCPIDDSRKLITMEHAGATVTIVGDSMEHELAIAQSISTTKFHNKKLKEVLKLFCQEKTSDGS